MTGQKGGQYNMAESSSGAADQALSTTSMKEQQGAPNGRTRLQDPATSWQPAAVQHQFLTAYTAGICARPPHSKSCFSPLPLMSIFCLLVNFCFFYHLSLLGFSPIELFA